MLPAMDNEKQVEQSNDEDDYIGKNNKVKYWYFLRIDGSYKKYLICY